MLGYQIWRATRLVVDTGVHTQGWTRQQAIDYLLKYTSLPAHEVETEVDRYIAWPGQALSYYLGETEIVKARARAEAALGRPVNGADCVIIGDTPMDVACGRPMGARAIAVATGHYDVAALTACAPDAVFADLTDTAAVLEAIRVA